MIVMGERRDPFEVIDIYSNKILANQSVAAIRRVLRDHVIEQADITTFKKLSNLLDAAYTADQTVTGANIRASSKYSLKILSQTLKTMEGTQKDTHAFRNILNDLHKTAIELSNGNINSDEKLNNLQDFCKRYAVLQRQLIKQPSIKPSYGVAVWPILLVLTHIPPVLSSTIELKEPKTPKGGVIIFHELPL